MAGPGEVVEQYFDAPTSKDFDKARSLLHDDLSFKGPFEAVKGGKIARSITCLGTVARADV